MFIIHYHFFALQCLQFNIYNTFFSWIQKTHIAQYQDRFSHSFLCKIKSKMFFMHFFLSLLIMWHHTNFSWIMIVHTHLNRFTVFFSTFSRFIVIFLCLQFSMQSSFKSRIPLLHKHQGSNTSFHFFILKTHGCKKLSPNWQEGGTSVLSLSSTVCHISVPTQEVLT